MIGLNNIMRATGYPKKAMLTSMVTVVCNIILAPIFIFQFDWEYGSCNGNGHLAVHRHGVGSEPFPAKDKCGTSATGSGR